MTTHNVKELITENYQKHVTPVLMLNDMVRRLTEDECDINATTIVVVGDQSHGKSSVIEALSGVQLPRGEGMKTKLPLSLHLRRRKEERETDYAEISAGKDGKVSEIGLDDVESAIEKLTDEIIGKDVWDIKDVEIDLTVYRQGQIDLDLIDLPGITRAAGHGVPEDIENRIVELYRRYITPEESIILNIVAVQTDTSNSKSLEMSLKLDKERVRTLLCLTKVDQYADGLDRLVSRVLDDSNAFHLKEGAVFCVRNRSQDETDQKLSLDEALVVERDFFQAAGYNQKMEGFAGLGCSVLAERLALIQKTRILQTLPGNIEKGKARLVELEEQVRCLQVFPKNEVSCISILNERLNELIKEMENGRTGRVSLNDDNFTEAEFQQSRNKSSSNDSDGTDIKDLRVDCAMFSQLKEKFGGFIRDERKKTYFFSPMFFDPVFDRYKQFTGHEGMPGSYPPHLAVDIVRSLQQGLYLHADNFASEVLSLVNRLAKTKVRNHFGDFPNLCNRITGLVEATYKKAYEALKLDIQTTRDCFDQVELDDHYFYAIVADMEQKLEYMSNSDESEIKKVLEGIGLDEYFKEIYKEFDSLKKAKDMNHTDLRRCGIDLFGQRDQVINAFSDYEPKSGKKKSSKKSKSKSKSRSRKESTSSSSNSDDGGTLEYFNEQKLKYMSNSERGVLDAIVRMYAYWKAMCKEYSANIIRLVKLHLFSERVESSIKEYVCTSITNHKDGLMSWMGPSEYQRKQGDVLEKRLGNLKELCEKCESLLEEMQH